MNKHKTKSRIYVCHTYYHVYVSFLKELNLPKHEQGTATLVLSKLSTNFEQLKDRVAKAGIFKEIYEYEENWALNRFLRFHGPFVSTGVAVDKDWTFPFDVVSDLTLDDEIPVYRHPEYEEDIALEQIMVEDFEKGRGHWNAI